MNHCYILGKSIAVFAFCTYFLLILAPIATMMDKRDTVYELWNHLDEFYQSNQLKQVLTENDWVSNSVGSEDLDHILVMTQQLQDQLFPDVPVEFVLAIISAESSFIQDLHGFNDDSGLMQVIPKWHKERIAKYLWDDSVDIFDVRVNLATGMDYLSELLELADGDYILAAMCYNEGPDKAIPRYRRGSVSAYAEVVYHRMQVIKQALNTSYGRSGRYAENKAASEIY